MLRFMRQKKVGDTLLAERLDEIFEELDKIERSLY